MDKRISLALVAKKINADFIYNEIINQLKTVKNWNICYISIFKQSDIFASFKNNEMDILKELSIDLETINKWYQINHCFFDIELHIK